MKKACEACGKEFEQKSWAVLSGRAKFCSRTCSASSRLGGMSPNWNGGVKHAKGYIYRLLPTHPNATEDGYVLEHRLVAENAIGRLLTEYEVIHHINGLRWDNRVENLYLFESNVAHVQYHSEERAGFIHPITESNL